MLNITFKPFFMYNSVVQVKVTVLFMFYFQPVKRLRSKFSSKVPVLISSHHISSPHLISSHHIQSSGSEGEKGDEEEKDIEESYRSTLLPNL